MESATPAGVVCPLMTIFYKHAIPPESNLHLCQSFYKHVMTQTSYGNSHHFAALPHHFGVLMHRFGVILTD